MTVTPYQFHYVLSGIKRQIPVSKSVAKLGLCRPYFMRSLSNKQRRMIDEYYALYKVQNQQSIQFQLNNRDIQFPDPCYVSMLSLYTL